MSSIRKLYEYAIEYEQVSLAHYILHLLQDGKVNADAHESSMDYSLADHEKVKHMIQTNVLGFKLIKPYSLKYNDNLFAFVFAENQDEAIKFFKSEFQTAPKNCHEYLLDFVIEKGNRFVSFRELKKEFKEFPAFIGFYERR